MKQSALVGGSLIFSGIATGSIFASSNPALKSGILDQTLLSEGWKIKPFEPGEFFEANHMAGGIAGDGEANSWFPVPSFPAMPHKILLHHNMIEEPWKPFGMEKCYWVSQKDWVYALNFQA